MKNKKVFFGVTEHFDLIWRRSFTRDIEFGGQNFISYADIQKYYIIDNISLCDEYDFYKFEIESVAVLEKFLELNPEYLSKIKTLIKEKKIFIPMTGNNIVDSNMVSGESIIRNYLYGIKYLMDNFGYDCESLSMNRNDAFGNSAQIPQIARKLGSRWITYIAYSYPENDYWRGIDGSTVYCFKANGTGYVGGYYKYRPCPVCGGHKDVECSYCNNRRIDMPYMEKLRVFHPMNDAALEKTQLPGYTYIGGEEILPTKKIVEWAIENKDKYDIEFNSINGYLPYISDKLDRCDEVGENELHPSMEMNANNTGTYVTRIKTKQELRKNENRIYGAETLAVMNLLKNGDYYDDEFTKIWRDHFLTMFHDAIPATHVDAGYEEIMDLYVQTEKDVNAIKSRILKGFCRKSNDTVTVINPYGVCFDTTAQASIESDKDIMLVDEDGNEAVITEYIHKNNIISVKFDVSAIKPYSKREYKIVEAQKTADFTMLPDVVKVSDADSPILTNYVESKKSGNDTKDTTIENNRYILKSDSHGITEIFDKKLNKAVAQKSEYYVGEVLLEHDEGSPWATLSTDMRRQKMSENTTLIEVVNKGNVQKLVYSILPNAIDAYSVTGLFVTYSVVLEKNCDMVKFYTNVSWDTQNYRLRIAFPTSTKGKNIYEIPYGTIERKPYEHTILFENGATNWASAAGDYPAIHWAGIQGRDLSVALFNRGTPSYQINSDCNGCENIFLSILRSPSVGTYLHSPLEYTMTAYDGMRDAGEHSFEYAFKSYSDGFDTNSAVLDGIGYNAEIYAICAKTDEIPQLPTITSDDACISSIKRSMDKKGIILRVVEYHGKDSSFKLNIPENFNVKNVYETDLREIKGTPTDKDSYVFNIGHYEIKTLYIEMN